MDLSQRMTGKRIVVRATTPDDAPAIYAYTVKHRNEYLKWENSVWRDEQEIRDFVSQRKSLAHYVICLNDIVIGTINVWDFSEKRMCCQLGWELNQDYVGHGYMTEALNLLIPELFRNGMIRIKVETRAENQRSINLAQRNGFIMEGVAKKEAFNRAQNKFVDTAMLAITNDANAKKLEDFYSQQK